MEKKLQQLLSQFGLSFSIESGKHVFRQGDTNTALYFVATGLLKAYYLAEDGKESIKSFIGQGKLIGSLSSAYTNEAASFNLLALEDCKLVKISFTQLYQQSTQDLALAQQLIHLLLELAMKKEKREYELLCLSAPERYQLLIDNEPELVDKLTQNDIARYLGVTPVALSRIKHRLNGKS